MKKVIDVLTFLFVYMMPFIFFLKIYNKKINKLVRVLFSIIYGIIAFISSAFVMNLVPFILVLINISCLRKIARENNDFSNECDYNVHKFSIKTIRLGESFKCILISYVMTTAVAVVTYIIFSKLNVNLKQQEVINIMSKMSMNQYAYMALVTVIFAPILEEFVFRYLLFQKIFKKKTGIYLSAIFSSVIFAFIHYNIQAFAGLLVLALINCYLIEKKGYWYAVMNHSFFNFVTTTIVFLQKIL
ncbi:CPBP family intramembrane glutamic endopeptidase [Haloimpatiens sp. FM7330]|uniref:CPBP family intramembrane glutamic endopeptidase n=1 Tax=Haloimpatiens sp. FM7330 TaxID=3298610 RepID=UPI00363F78A4